MTTLIHPAPVEAIETAPAPAVGPAPRGLFRRVQLSFLRLVRRAAWRALDMDTEFDLLD